MAQRVKRGDIWTVAGGADYTGKPRPALILQNDLYDVTQSVTICPFTSNAAAAPLFRVEVAPAEGNGLREVSHLMVDKLTTVPRSRLGFRIGQLADDDMQRVGSAVVLFLGLAGTSTGSQQSAQ